MLKPTPSACAGEATVNGARAVTSSAVSAYLTWGVTVAWVRGGWRLEAEAVWSTHKGEDEVCRTYLPPSMKYADILDRIVTAR